MADVEEIIRRLIEISEVEIPGGWRGWVAVRNAGRERFSKSEWLELLAEPEKLPDGAQQTLKSDGQNSVVVKYLAAGGRGVKAVIKRHRRGRGLREFFRSLGPPRSMQNFIAAVKTSQYGLPVAAPLAAVYRRRFLFCKESIYLSEYVEGVNLYEFLRNLPTDVQKRHNIVRRIAGQIARLLATMHTDGFWHRDAKATNFIVSGDGPDNYRIVITDMDGIKRNVPLSRDRQMRALWQMAASVMALPGIGRTDYMRVFRAYCDNVEIPQSHRRDVLEGLVQEARAKYRRKIEKQNSHV